MGKEIKNLSVYSSIAFLAILLLALFFAYPLVILNPPRFTSVNHPFMFRFPIEVIVCALSFTFLLLNFYKLKSNRLIILPILFALLVVLSGFLNKALPEHVMRLIGYFLVPFAVAIAVLKSGFFSEYRQKLIMCFLGVLWLVCIVWSFLFQSPVGISGNQNWFASVNLALAPWAFFGLYHFLRTALVRVIRVGQANWVSGACSLIAVACISLYWLWRSGSRGAGLALIIFISFTLLAKISVKWRICVLVLALCSTWSFVNNGALKQAATSDIRGPLWTSTATMISDAVFLGRGPGNFRKVYTQYRSAEHSIRLVSALSTEHAHNELLNVAAEVGAPAALIWLAFMLFILSIKVRTREGYCAKFGFVILLVHSFFDKGLVSPPGSILFWILSGLLLATWLRQRLEITRAPVYFQLTVLLLSLICFIPIGNRIKGIVTGSLQYRKIAVWNSLYEKGLLKGDKKIILKRLYEGYREASVTDPTNVLYPYMALNIAIEKMGDTDLAIAPLKDVLRLDGNYEHINYLAAMYYFRLGSKQMLAELQEKMLKIADGFIIKELQLYPYNLKTAKFVQDFLLLKKQNTRANKLDQYVGAVCVEMFLQKFVGSPEGAGESLRNWQAYLKAGSVDFALQEADEALRGFKGVDTIDVLLSSLASASGFMRNNAQRKFHQSDFDYWREMFALKRFFNKSTSASEMVSTVISHFDINRDKSFIFPGELLSLKEVSELSVSCLLRIAAHHKGYISFLVKVETLGKVHWLVYTKSENEGVLFWPSQKKMIKGDWQDLLKRERLSKEFGEGVRKVDVALFEYPQAFYQRNVYFSKIVSRGLKDVADFCSSPSLVKINLERYLNGYWRINYLKEPFDNLEKKYE